MKPVALLVVLAISSLVGLGVRKYFGGAATVVPVAAVPLAEVSKIERAVEKPPPPPGPVNPVFNEQLEIRGYIRRGNKVSVQLSDGSRVTHLDNELVRVEANSVTLCRSHPQKQKTLCPFCRKYAVKPGVIVAATKSEKAASSASGAAVAPAQKQQTTGAANVVSEYRGEAVIPVNGNLSTEFTIGRRQ